MTNLKPVHGSQQFLLTLLGTYFLGVEDEIPSTFFVDVLSDFGLSETAARNALSRVARQGFLEPSKRGRATYYALTETARRRQQRRLKQIVDFGRTYRAWDGQWTIVTFSVNEEQRHLRHQIRQVLRQQGFGVLYDGVWVRPWPLGQDESSALLNIGIDRMTVFACAPEVAFAAQGDPVAAFNVEGVRPLLDYFISRATTIVESMEADAISPTAALRLRIETLRDWKEIGESHPELPAELLPADWPLCTARRLFERTYDGLAHAAEARMRHHIGLSASDLVPVIKSLSTLEVAELGQATWDAD
ncbi:phenylacetic acid degradation operon negative regulatory protein [Arthrobacter bambusae]|uniref:Phenylacetic acid degradation operon negative regulatory protein n=1 Tax=Arthrobacter bambusae TaxID=1338426 RepID=A0ABV2P119_9MICC